MSGSFGVTAIVPVRDGLPYVVEAIESALNQTLPAAEIVVVDDDSHDGSGDLVERRYRHRVRLVRGNFGSAAAARNAGLRAAQTEFVAFLDADDVWFSEKLAVARQRLTDAPAASWFFSDGAFRTLAGQLHSSWFSFCADLAEPYCGSPLMQLFEVNFVLTSSVVARRAALEAAGGFDERFTHGEDLDLWIRLARQGLATASRRALVRYQHRAGGLSQQTEKRLRGGARVFDALSTDATLTDDLRRRARRRASLYHHKLGLTCLREGRPSEARREFLSAAAFPGRAPSAWLGVAASMLPGPVFRRLRGLGPVAGLAAPLFAVGRAELRGWMHPETSAGARDARRKERP